MKSGWRRIECSTRQRVENKGRECGTVQSEKSGEELFCGQWLSKSKSAMGTRNKESDDTSCVSESGRDGFGISGYFGSPNNAVLP